MAKTDILRLIGHTPMVRLNRIAPAGGAKVWVKLESLNPGGSIKDRIALGIVKAAEAQGNLGPGGTLVEATAGNTGISLALVAAAQGYRLILAMPESVAPELRRFLLRLGADIVLTPAPEGMAGAMTSAERLINNNLRYFLCDQFHNPANPEAHRRTTAQELLKDTGGRIDAFVAGIGTGGTITGVGEVLKQKVPGVRLIGLEPASSPLLSQGWTGPHAIPGIGANFVPPLLNRDIIDEVLTVPDSAAREMALRLAREEGLAAGLSGGANVWGAIRVAQGLGPGKVVITILPDGAERYWNQFFSGEAPPEAVSIAKGA